MKYLTPMIFAILTLLFFNSCQKETEDTQTWHLVKWYGTIAGISKDYSRGQCTWTFQDSTLEIKNSQVDPFVLSKTTTFTTNIESGKEIIDIDGVGTFTKTISNDTMYLVAPCCDFIDYTLVK